MDLSKCGNQYLSEGRHIVKIKDTRLYTAVHDGVEFSCEDKTGGKTKASFSLTNKALYRLASFARACGMSNEDLKTYEHHKMVGRYVLVHVVLDDKRKYHQVDTNKMAWWPHSTNPATLPPIGAERTAATEPEFNDPPAAEEEPPGPTEAPPHVDNEGADDLPF